MIADSRDSRWSSSLVETAGGIVIVGRDSWMINILVVQYFILTRGCVDVFSSVDAESFVD